MESNLTPLQRVQSPYLRPSNLANTIFEHIHDSHIEVRKATRTALVSLGHFGRFVMIEGLRKEKNASARAECVLGLSEFGALSIRPIVIGMTDSDMRVVQ
jgi:hypothetical protein